MKPRRMRRRIDDAKLRELWHSRIPDKLIAKTMNHHIGVLRRRAIRIGLPSRRKLWERDT